VVARLMLLACIALVFSRDESTTILVKVNGTAITAGDVNFAASQQGILEENRSQSEPKLIERLIDRQLIRSFLAAKKIEPPAEDLQFQIARAEALIRKGGEDPKALLEKLGYTPERLKSELGLTLAWQVYARKTVTPMQIKAHYEQFRQEFDGTQVRASQIFLKLPQPASDEEKAAASGKLNEIRRQILANKLSFAEAAKRFSEAPTKNQGGDVGLFGFRGKLPASVSQAAFGLKVNDISEPVVSTFGVHLIQVTERHPGDFSLEDVRPVIIDRLSQQLWSETVEQQRLDAKIERLSKP
jgi:parvulin-like peptidyl-prolyl isomerase